ncbi:MAG: Gfo/Idh/MocA family oxidoreductase [Spirochaetota bacterium]
MPNKKIGLCVIGAGRAGMIHAENFLRGIPHAELIALADPLEESLETACRKLGISQKYLDYRAALENKNIKAVIVATPTVLHKEIVAAACMAGKHVLCEKPMAMNVSECDAMLHAAEDNKVKLQIGFMRRFDRSFREAKLAIEGGEIGDVVLVKSLTHGPSLPRKWMYDIRKSNGPLAEVNSHDIDTLRWYTGSEFKEVYAVAGNFRCPDAKAEYPDFYDNVVMNALFENGMQGVIDGAVSVQYGYDARVEILGTRGIMFLGRLEDTSIVLCNSASRKIQPVTKSWRNLFKHAYLAEDESFIQSVLEDKTPEVTGYDGKMAVTVVSAGNRSILEKKPISLK